MPVRLAYDAETLTFYLLRALAIGLSCGSCWIDTAFSLRPEEQ